MAFPSHAPLPRIANADSDPPCQLLQLPAELRLEIYSHILIPSPELLSHLRPQTSRMHLSTYLVPALDICPNILRTCKQIHDEAAPILYTSSMFCAHSAQLTASPYLISPDRPIFYSRFSKEIRKWYISVRLDIDARFTRRDVQLAFSGCETLEILAWQTMFGVMDLRILELFEDVRGVRLAKVHGSVSRRYSKWLEDAMMSDVGSSVRKFRQEHGGEGWDLWTHGNR